MFSKFLLAKDYGFQCQLCLFEVHTRKDGNKHIGDKHNLELRDVILAESRKISTAPSPGRPKMKLYNKTPVPKDDTKKIEKKFKCSSCSKLFVSKYLAKKHHKEVHVRVDDSKSGLKRQLSRVHEKKQADFNDCYQIDQFSTEVILSD